MKILSTLVVITALLGSVSVNASNVKINRKPSSATQHCDQDTSSDKVCQAVGTSPVSFDLLVNGNTANLSNIVSPGHIDYSACTVATKKRTSFAFAQSCPGLVGLSIKNPARPSISNSDGNFCYYNCESVGD